MASRMKNIRRCPFCSCGHVETARTRPGRWWVMCHGCGAEGPTAPPGKRWTEMAAVEAWNRALRRPVAGDPS